MNNKKANDLIPLSDPPSVLDYVKDDGRRPASNLERLSSFVKEAQRSCFPDLTTFHHNPSASVTLSNGFCIPKSATNEVASGAINADVELSDIPSEFDDLRFYKERQDGPGGSLEASIATSDARGSRSDNQPNQLTRSLIGHCPRRRT
ncbi:uncharacterized protein CCOS01_01888 [Colletotrichum costaricense]|uniref:Uncharacterized protein n=1 Tax=Colletotrichum costaricense TaxID=1209916 RepID=A0AAI9Z894_9PEZI|nr:uncharacterized protein CCOS01_01888 [Colletotrichum costaricense]KAK1536568.1 hypothetical protein CCOS01_01888 [Colletotrichum costaricense]